MKRHIMIIATSFVALAACSKTGSENAGQQQAQGTGIGIDTAWMDKSVKPGDDFFSFADGSWVKNTAIPADRSRIGGFWIADLQREKNSRELFDSILKSNPTSGNDALVANYYKAYLNTDAIDRAGLAPAKADLDGIAKIADKHQLSAAIGGTLRADTDPLNATNYQTPNLFGIFVTQGLATPGEQLPYLMQGGIGLPERDYYLSADAKMADIRNKYRAYIQTILQDAGYPDPQGAAGRIMELETKIAKAHEAREISEDTGKGAQVWTQAAARAEGAGNRLGGAAQRGAARKRPEVRRLSLRCDPEACRAGRFRTAPELEGLARLPHAQQPGERASQAVPRRELRLLRDRACRHAAAAAARHPGAQRRRATRCRTPSARPMSTNISPPRPRHKSRRWWST